MKTVLVTGAGGYIGRHTVNALIDDGASVVTLDMSNRTVRDGCRHITADILSPKFSLCDHFDVLPDVCLHLAWRNGFNHNDASHMHDLSDHYRFLEGLFDAGISQITIMGTMHEIGYWEGAITEDTPCNPLSLYGLSKDALRRAVFLQSAGSATIVQWLRGFYIYGDDEGSQSIFGKIKRAASSGKASFPFTTGQNEYDFLSVDELARQISACVMQSEVAGVINCCSGKPVSLAEQVEWFIKSNGFNITLEYGAYPDRPYDSPAVWGDPAKIQSIMAAASIV